MLLIKRIKEENISQERWNKPRIISSGSFVYLKHSLLSCVWLHRSFFIFLMHTRNKEINRKYLDILARSNLKILWYMIKYTIILTAILYGQITAQKGKSRPHTLATNSVNILFWLPFIFPSILQKPWHAFSHQNNGVTWINHCKPNLTIMILNKLKILFKCCWGKYW